MLFSVARTSSSKKPSGTYEELASLQAISAQSSCALDVTFNKAAREDNAWLVETVQQGKIGAID